MTKLFFLGVTGYIGGDALFAIAHAHPDYEITALVRNSEKGAQVASQYPKIRLVYGDNKSSDLIEEEVSKADIVLHFANSADDVDSVTSIIAGLESHPSATPVYYIHTSGAGILTVADFDRKTYGEASTKIYNDWDGINEVTSLPDHAVHRNVDKLVLSAGTKNTEKIKTAIVTPACIYGPGRGPGHQSSIQIPALVRSTLKKGHGIQVGEGKTFWCGIDVHDLSNIYVLLVEAAAAGGGNATWGAEGYYFGESGDIVWGHVAKLIAQAAHKRGFIKDDSLTRYSAEEVIKFEPYGAHMWGANSRSRAIRARKLLGWEPKGASLEETIEGIVDLEAKDLGLVPGHAKTAAGDA